MRPSSTFAVVATAGFLGENIRTGLSFPFLAPTVSRRGHFHRRRASGRCSRIRCHIAAAPAAAAAAQESYPVGYTRNHRSHTGLRSLASAAELPSLDGLPGGVSSPSSSSTSARSRRGKYPVVELWRRELEDDFIFDRQGCEDDDGDNDLLGGHPIAATGGAQTALEHLRAVLGLGTEQANVMQESFPALAEVHPDRLDLPAKLRFLRHTLGGDGPEVALAFPQFFGHPLERHIAPRHAFLVASGRPSGVKLLEGDCRGLRRMLELPANRFVAEMVPGREMPDYRRFEQGFLRGPFDAARKGYGDTLRLLRSHGWDCWETDRRGRTALFWAAGGGSVDACAAVTEGEGGLSPRDPGGDGSTPLHWAAAGVETRRFGTGGHVDVCRWLLNLGADPGAKTIEGNTVVMWAAWAGGLDATRWAVEEGGADLDAANANGCSVAHWAASGGNEAVCRYLHSKGVDFARQNKGGNDPLNHAVAYGRRDIAAWLLEEGGRPPHGVRTQGEGREAEALVRTRRRDDPVLLDLARLTGDEKMEAFLMGDD